jgi:hypothetical protein
VSRTPTHVVHSITSIFITFVSVSMSSLVFVSTLVLARGQLSGVSDRGMQCLDPRYPSEFIAFQDMLVLKLDF